MRKVGALAALLAGLLAGGPAAAQEMLVKIPSDWRTEYLPVPLPPEARLGKPRPAIAFVDWREHAPRAAEAMGRCAAFGHHLALERPPRGEDLGYDVFVALAHADTLAFPARSDDQPADKDNTYRFTVRASPGRPASGICQGFFVLTGGRVRYVSLVLYSPDPDDLCACLNSVYDNLLR